MASRRTIATLSLRANPSFSLPGYSPLSRTCAVRARVIFSPPILCTPPPQLCPFIFSLGTKRAVGPGCRSSRGLRYKSGDPTAGKPTSTFKRYQFDDIKNAISSSSPSPRPTVLVDVREHSELLSTGIIPTALSMPLASQPDALFLPPDEFITRFGYPKPGTGNDSSPESGSSDPDIVFYCKVGVRARAAAKLAVQAGYDSERVAVYDGSWLDWTERGGKVERWNGLEG